MCEQPSLPVPRGALSEAIVDALRRPPGPLSIPPLGGIDGLVDDDLHLALHCCYELHYASYRGVEEGWEWEPAILAFRRELERAFVGRLVDEIGPPDRVRPEVVAGAIRDLAAGDGPSLSDFMARRATRQQFREFLVHRSAYQRKEADPHTWAVPRLRGPAKAAMVAIQYDEYGDGVAEAMHSELFAVTMSEFGLDPEYGAYVSLLPGTTLATDNLVTMFGLHRRWRAACVGHLALFELTSVGPMQRYAKAARRLGTGLRAPQFYDVHVSVDAVHERVQEGMVASFLNQEPAASGIVIFGARALIEVERRFTQRLLEGWAAGSTALLGPLPADPGLLSSEPSISPPSLVSTG